MNDKVFFPTHNFTYISVYSLLYVFFVVVIVVVTRLCNSSMYYVNVYNKYEKRNIRKKALILQYIDREVTC